MNQYGGREVGKLRIKTLGKGRKDLMIGKKRKKMYHQRTNQDLEEELREEIIKRSKRDRVKNLSSVTWMKRTKFRKTRRNCLNH